MWANRAGPADGAVVKRSGEDAPVSDRVMIRA
jgi:hypothetical protein